jgi:hypothetical protein
MPKMEKMEKMEKRSPVTVGVVAPDPAPTRTEAALRRNPALNPALRVW